MQDRSKNLRAFAGTQFTRIASSNAVNRAYDLASKAKVAVVEQAASSRPHTPPVGANGQPQTWKEWALQKIPMRGPPVVGVEAGVLEGVGTEMVGSSLLDIHIVILTVNSAGFTLELHVSGFASSLRPPEQATRSQKAFMAIARRMAALPKLPPGDGLYAGRNTQSPFSPSTQDLLQPQVPEEDREAEEIQALNAELAEMPAELRPSITRETAGAASQSIPLDQLRRMHANVDARLQPFWSSSVPNRPVKLSIFSAQEEDKDQIVQATSYTPLGEGRKPLFTVQTSTDAQGTFTEQVTIPYEVIATNPEALSIAFGGYDTEPKLLVQAELKPLPEPIGLMESQEYFSGPKIIATHISIPVSNQQIRVISDIDDTVKVADVLAGVKKIFNNVFVRALEELIAPGMNTFYQNLHEKGVRFHYVSNSPYGLLPILTEFLQVAQLPQGSLKLRFYGGRSLFGGLWEPAGERKRGGVVSILDNFSESKFFLIGDTGEQDLDLYVELARERPEQILGIFLRDVVPNVVPAIDHLLGDQYTEEPQTFDPSPTSTPLRPMTPASTSTSISSSKQPPPYTPYVSRSRSGTDPKRSLQQQPQPVPAMMVRRSFIDDDPIMPGRDPWPQSSGDQAKMSPAERRRWELDQKIARAKDTLPPHIVFRVFRHPDEIEEVYAIINNLSGQRSSGG